MYSSTRYPACSNRRRAARPYPLVCRPFEGKPRRQSPSRMRSPVSRPWAADDAGEEAGEIVGGGALEGAIGGLAGHAVGGAVRCAIESGYLCGLSAEQGTAGGLAGVDETGDDLLDDVGIEVAGGEVVHEVERGGTLDGDVVDAVVDEIGTDGGVEAELGGELELGTDAVGSGDEDGVGEALGVEGEGAVEATDLGEDLAVEGATCEALDAFDRQGAAGVRGGTGAGWRHREVLCWWGSPKEGLVEGVELLYVRAKSISDSYTYCYECGYEQVTGVAGARRGVVSRGRELAGAGVPGGGG